MTANPAGPIIIPPGTTLLFETDADMTADDCRRAQQAISARFPNNSVVLVTGCHLAGVIE
jgi:hypothetical protein